MQDYECIRLRKNHTRRMPTHVVYLDTESRMVKAPDREKHTMDMAWSCFARYDKQCDIISEAWEYWESEFRMWEYIADLIKAKQTLYIIGHNVFYDLQCSDFFYHFTKWGAVLDFYYENQLTYILMIRLKGKLIKCLSSTNWYDTSLKGLGKMIGLEKLEVDFGKTSREDLKTYCRRDVEIVKVAMEQYFKFVLKHDLGKFSLTKASQAFNAFRHRFMSTPIYAHKEQDIRDLERLAYFGGRVECFQIGKVKGGPFLSLDINSQYPYVMKQTFVPTRLVHYEEDVDLGRADDITKTHCVVAEIEVNTDLPIYPYRMNDKTVYPIGQFTAHVCTKGLKEAIRRGHCREVKRLAVYNRAVLFSDYVDYLYPFKDIYGSENKPVMRELIKKLLNALYGKFAQKRPVIEETEDITFDGYFRMECYNLVTGERGVEYKMLNKYVFEYGHEDSPMSFIGISAHITEAARFLLWHIMESTGLDRILYVDTDSIKIRKRDLKYVTYPIDDHDLGALSLEHEFKTFEVLGPKSYKTEHFTKMKGIPKDAEKTGPVQYQYFSWPKQRTHLHQQVTRFYQRDRVSKTLKLTYDKGKVGPTGRVTPFVLPTA